MRVCLIGNARASHLQRWALAYRDVGLDTHVLSIRSADIVGVTVHTTSIGTENSVAAPQTAASYLRLGAQARSELRRIDPDVVNAHFVTTSGVIARVAGTHPLVVSAWGSDVVPRDGSIHPRWRLLLDRYALGGADIVTTTSRFMGSWIAAIGPSDLDLRTVPFGVDTSHFTPVATSGDGTTFGIAKSLEPRYGIETALQAFARVRSVVDGASLLIAGEGRLRADLEAVTAALGIEDAVRFLGRLEVVEMPEFMRSIDVLINPTVVPESFGVVVLEGSAAALPVVSTDVGGVREVCVPNETAILVPPGDPTAMADALVSLASEPDQRSRLGAAGRRFVAEHFEWRDSVATMIGILREATGAVS